MSPQNLPAGFVYLAEIDPSIVQDIKYAGADNFLGRPVKGYVAAQCILSQKAAERLKIIQSELGAKSLGLKIFDGYRPQMAVDDFVQWSQDATDQKMKALYYPRVNKAEVFKLGYVMERSGHTRGSTVDLTLIRLDSNTELDMGTRFDFLDALSHPSCREITEEQYLNRMILRTAMLEHGFVPVLTEWWHFTLEDEPFKDTYFNFPVIGRSEE